MNRRHFLAASLAAGAVGAGSGLRAGARPGDPTHRLVLPGLANDAAHAASRSYALGFNFVAPEATIELTLRTIDEISRVGEYTIIQREVPWKQIFAGIPMATILRDEYEALVSTMRGKGLKLVLLVDPLDGLNRRLEPPELIAAGRSILEPQIRALHEEWVRLIAAAVQPEYFGLASEINTLAGHGDPARYAVLRSMINALAPEVRRLSPRSQVFVSFQVDDAWDPIFADGRDIDHFALIQEFDIDVLGLSSYPYFYRDTPADIPPDYYRRFALASGGLPLIQVEGGWPSALGPRGNGTPELQVAYFKKLFDLLDSVEAKLCVMITYTDLNLAHPSWADIPADRIETLGAFARLGIVDAQFRPKPSFTTWLAQHGKPLQS